MITGRTAMRAVRWMLCLCCTLAMGPIAAGDDAPAARGENADGLTMSVVEPVDLLVGEHAVFRVELRNQRADRVRLIRPLYDSLGHRRYPRLTIEVTDEKGAAVKFQQRPGPVKQSELYESSFIVFGPGETARFEVRWPFVEEGFAAPGRYRVRIIYDTRAPDLDAWQAWPPDELSAPDNPVGRREMSAWLEQVRPVLMVAETTVTVHELTPARFRAMLLASTRDRDLARDLDQAFTSGDIRVDSMRTIGGATLVSVQRTGAASPTEESDGIGDIAYVVQPAVLRPSNVRPFDGFRGSAFQVDPVSRVPAWRRQQLGLPAPGR